MFGGKSINNTEGRAVLHTALRNRGSEAVDVDGENVMPAVKRVLKQMAVFSEDIREGKKRGYRDDMFTDVVNIGIGGSDLGPLMVTEALQRYSHSRLNLHFVSNVDGSHIASTLEKLDPATTLFIIACTFST